MAPTPEQIAATQAAIKAKPADAVLVAAPRDVADGYGHLTPAGELVWRWYGAARYDGPPDATSAMYRSEHWTCRACGDRKGWETHD